MEPIASKASLRLGTYCGRSRSA